MKWPPWPLSVAAAALVFAVGALAAALMKAPAAWSWLLSTATWVLIAVGAFGLGRRWGQP